MSLDYGPRFDGGEWEPWAPQGVELSWPDGSRVRVPVPVVYIGTEDDGMHRWEVVLTDDQVTELVMGEAQLRVALLPPYTTIGLPLTSGEVEE